ncbi:hypothetical protein C9415_10155 [Kluyvera sp. Nf5]|nr:hypothetical protein C9415_10155 [Kluyvera sp. Nf5]
MKDETLLPCPFCGGKAEFDHDDYNLIWISCSACGVSTDTAYHSGADARETLREAWNRRALQSGNSGRLNRANSFTDDELMGMAHGDNPVANAYRELLEFRRNAAGGNSAQPVMTSSKLESGENCWSCGKYFTYTQHSECDGYCPHCDSPVDLDD